MPPLGPITLAIEVSNPAPGPTPGPGVHETADAPTSVPPRAGVALGRGNAEGHEILGVEWLSPRSRHDDALMPAIDALCRRCGVQPGDLGRVAVSVGPGGYTSLRIGVTTAKAIALSTGAACIAVPTAHAVVRALPKGGSNGKVVVCLAWKRESVWRQMFTTHAGGSATPDAEGSVVPLEELKPDVATILVAEAPLLRLLRDQSLLPEGIRSVEPEFDPRHVIEASLVLAPIDPLQLAPMYPREPEAVTKWRIMHPPPN